MTPVIGPFGVSYDAGFGEADAGVLFDECPFGIAWLDTGGGIRRCNPALGRLLGRDPLELVGRAFADSFAAEDRDDARAQLAKLVMGTARRVSIESLRLADGGQESERAVALFVSAVERDGEIAGLLAHVLDVTERRNLEVRFAHAQKLQALGQLAGSIAHDFNNLIAGMLGSCDLLLSRASADDPTGDDLWLIRGNALRARDLVHQLLAFARKQPLRPIPLRLERAVDQLAPMLRRLLGPAITIEVQHEAGLSAARVDPGQFDQVIVNLCVNARDAMPEGGLLTLRVAQVTLAEPTQRGTDIIPAGGFVVVEVADTGSGIPKEIIDDIFQPFFTTKPSGKGTGLGLATVWGIVRQSGGHVVVDSALGVGTTFRLFLPAVPAAARARAVAAPGERPAAPWSQVVAGTAAAEAGRTQATVLLVDDEEAVRRFAARALRGRGYRVLEAADGETAMAAMGDGTTIDVLLTDYGLPDMRGTVLVEYARQHHPAACIIVISAELCELPEDLEGSPPMTLLPKPFTLSELVTCVGRVMTV